VTAEGVAAAIQHHGGVAVDADARQQGGHVPGGGQVVGQALAWRGEIFRHVQIGRAGNVACLPLRTAAGDQRGPDRLRRHPYRAVDDAKGGIIEACLKPSWLDQQLGLAGAYAHS
jgi:hypothetical protein